LVTGSQKVRLPATRWRKLATRKLPEVDELIARLQTVRALLEASLAADA